MRNFMTIVALTLLASPAFAQPSTVIPFDGYLEFDGVPLDGEYGVRVRLFNSADDTTVRRTEEYSADDTRSCDEVDACRVPFYRGEFSLLIGYWTSYANYISTNTVFVEVDVQSSDGEWVSLQGRRQVSAAPYTLWSATASEMVVGGSAQVTESSDLGDTTVDGAASMGTLSTTGLVEAASLDISGDLTLGAGDALTVDGLLDATGDITFSDELRLNGYTLLSVDGTTLTIGGGGEVDAIFQLGSVYGHEIHLDGVLTIDGDIQTSVDSSGIAYRGFEGDEPLLQVVQVRAGTSQNVDTGVLVDDWFCWIGGFRFVNGDWDVSGDDSNVFDLYTYESGDNWWIRARVNNDQEPRKEITMICAQDEIVESGYEWITE